MCTYIYCTSSTFRHVFVTHAKLRCAPSRVQKRAEVVVVYGDHEQEDNTVSADSLGAAPLSVIKPFGPSLEYTETACVVNMCTSGRHASTCILLEEAVCQHVVRRLRHRQDPRMLKRLLVTQQAILILDSDTQAWTTFSSDLITRVVNTGRLKWRLVRSGLYNVALSKSSITLGGKTNF